MEISLVIALIALVIAAITAYTAYQQKIINDRRFKMDLYDKRMRVYRDVLALIVAITNDEDINIDDIVKFRRSVAESEFLFGSDICRYIDKLFNNSIDHWYCSKEYRSYIKKQSGDVVVDFVKHDKVVSDMADNLKWFSAQYKPATEKFRKYLNLNE